MNGHENMDSINLQRNQNHVFNENVIHQQIVEQQPLHADQQNIQVQGQIGVNANRNQQNIMADFEVLNMADFQHQPQDLDPELIEQGKYVPPHAIHRNLYKALNKIYGWKNLKQKTSLPLRNAVGKLLDAKTNSQVSSALEDILDTSINYMKINSGHRSVFGSGETRKNDVRALLSEISVYVANNTGEVMRAYRTKVGALGVSSKYAIALQENYIRAVRDVYNAEIAGRENQEAISVNQACDNAAERQAALLEEINGWGGMKAKAQSILDREKQDFPKEQFVEANILDENVINIKIPDIKSLNEYELLTNQTLPDMREGVLNKLKQNLNYLIATGGIDDEERKKEISSKLTLLERQLDVYDARMRIIAGRAQDGDDELVRNGGFLEDLEKEAREDYDLSKDRTRELMQYKKLAGLIRPGMQFSKQDLAERDKLIEKRRAQKDYIAGAKKLAKKEEIAQPAEYATAEAKLIHYKAEADKILREDYSILLDMDVSENNLLKNAAKKYEIISKLEGIDSMIEAVNSSEADIEVKKLRNLTESGSILIGSEKRALGALSIVGKQFRDYYDALTRMNETEGSTLLSIEDYQALSEETKNTLLTRPEGKDATTERLRLYELCSRFKEVLDIRNVFSEQMLNYVNMVKNCKDSIPVEREKIETARQERIRKEYEDLLKDALSLSRDKNKEIDVPDDPKSKKKLKEKELSDIGSKAGDMIYKMKRRAIEKILKSKQGAVDSFGSLGEKGKTKEDAKAVREECLKAMMILSGIEKSELDLMETEEIISFLQDEKLMTFIKYDEGKGGFDDEAFKEEVEKALDKNLDSKAELSSIEELKNKKDRSAKEELLLRDKCIKCFDIYIDRVNKSRAVLEDMDMDSLVEYATNLLKVAEIEVDPESEYYKEKPTREQEELFKKTTIAELVRMSGKKEADFEELSLKRLGEIYYEAVSRIGSKKMDMKKYINFELTVEKRSRLINDAIGAFSGLNKEDAKEEDIKKVRETMISSLCELTGAKESEYEFVGFEELRALLTTAGKNVRNINKLKLKVSEGKDKYLSANTAENFSDTLKKITEMGGVSKEYKNTLIKDLSVDVYIKMAKSLGFLDDKAEVSKKDFDEISGDKLAAVVLMGSKIAKYKEDELEYEEKNEYREANLSLVYSVLQMNYKYLEKMPTFDLSKMAKRLVSSAKDSKAFAEAVQTSVVYHKQRYASGDFLNECVELLGAYKQNKNNTYALDQCKDICIYYLMEVSGVADYSREELLSRSAVELFEATKTQYEADKNNPASAINHVDDIDDEEVILKYSSEIKNINSKMEQLASTLNRMKEMQGQDQASDEFEKKYNYLYQSFIDLGKARQKLAEARGSIAKNMGKMKDGYTDTAARESLEVLRYLRPVLETNQESYKAYLEIKKTGLEAYRKKHDNIIIPQVKTDWEKDEKDTLNMMGDLVSSEKFFYEDGSEVKGAERIKFILYNNAELVTKILNGIDSGKKDHPLAKLGDNITGTEGKLLKAMAGPFFDKMLQLFARQYGDKKEINTAIVRDFIKVRINSKDLSELENEMNSSMKSAGDVAINSLISRAASDLFGGETEPIAPIFEEVVEENVNVEKTQEELDKEKLKKLRDSVFDTKNGQGKFLYLVIKDYYANAPEHLKKSMMSYLLKDLKPSKTTTSSTTKGAEFFASMLKGAGPIMQKLFQGIPEHMLSEPFRPALSVVKSKLRPISPEYVDKKLTTIMKNANAAAKDDGDKIAEIKKIKSLGAASIAETFLCEVKYQGRPSAQVVVKIMRPELDPKSLENEKTFIMDCANKTDESGVMQATFSAHYKKMREELDFGNEANNVKLGMKAYSAKDKVTGDTVGSVSLSQTIPSGKDYLVMDLAKGTTLDRYIEEIGEFINKKLEEFKGYDSNTGKYYNIKPGDEEKRLKIRQEIAQKLVEAQKCHGHMEKLVEQWIQMAFFTETTNGGYFHHGDLHSGNIMINEEQATVLDYGNCSVLKSGGRIPDIINMMAAAFIGRTDKFVSALERVLVSEGQDNAYNSLSSNEKEALIKKVTKELDEIMKLGGTANTGERIFVSFLKVQQLGISLPQELQNFSQCQQRLENSLSEFTAAVKKLETALNIIDTMPITYPEGIDKSTLDPIQKMNFKIMDPDYNSQVPNAAYYLFRSFMVPDKNELWKELSDNYSRGIFFAKNLNDLDLVKSGFIDKKETKSKDKDEPPKKTYNQVKENISRWKKDFPDYSRLRNATRKNLKKSDQKRYDKVMNIGQELLELNNFFVENKGYMFLAGVDYSKAVALAIQGSQEHFDKLMGIFDKMTNISDLISSYQKFTKAKSGSKDKDALKATFIKNYMEFYQKYQMDNTYIGNIAKHISPDTDIDNYHRYLSVDSVIEKIDKELTWPSERRHFLEETKDSTKENPKYVYGDHSKKILELSERYKELAKNENTETNSRLKAEKDKVEKELLRLSNLLTIRRITIVGQEKAEADLIKYLNEDSALGKQLRTSYANLKRAQQEYIEFQLETSDTKKLEMAKEKRLKADSDFYQTFIRLMNKYVMPVVKPYATSCLLHLESFVSIMSMVLGDNSGSVFLMLGTKDSFMYKKKISELMKAGK